jgi:hypothetical protein
MFVSATATEHGRQLVSAVDWTLLLLCKMCVCGSANCASVALQIVQHTHTLPQCLHLGVLACGCHPMHLRENSSMRPCRDIYYANAAAMPSPPPSSLWAGEAPIQHIGLCSIGSLPTSKTRSLSEPRFIFFAGSLGTTPSGCRSRPRGLVVLEVRVAVAA